MLRAEGSSAALWVVVGYLSPVLRTVVFYISQDWALCSFHPGGEIGLRGLRAVLVVGSGFDLGCGKIGASRCIGRRVRWFDCLVCLQIWLGRPVGEVARRGL